LDENGLEKLWESFKLDESNEAAENAILALIDESVRAIIAVVVDVLHVWAGYMR